MSTYLPHGLVVSRTVTASNNPRWGTGTVVRHCPLVRGTRLRRIRGFDITERSGAEDETKEYSYDRHTDEYPGDFGSRQLEYGSEERTSWRIRK